MSSYLAEARLLHLWDEAKRNIGEYWFGIPAVPEMRIVWELPKCLYPMTHVESADDLQMVSLTDAWIYRHIHETASR